MLGWVGVVTEKLKLVCYEDFVVRQKICAVDFDYISLFGFGRSAGSKPYDARALTAVSIFEQGNMIYRQKNQKNLGLTANHGIVRCAGMMQK
jgi:hypothetical protein